MSCEIHLNDIGTVFRLTILDCENQIIPISNASNIIITFKKPSGVSVAKLGTLYTDGEDGKVQYVTIANDLDEIGNWKIQAKVTLPTGTWNSNIESFKVYDNL